MYSNSNAFTMRRDATLCNGFWARKQIKELVNSARIFAAQQGKKFTWIHVRLEILKSLTDVTLTARCLALSRLKRKSGSTAKLWISQVMTRRALLEDPRLPTPVMLPETLYLELTVGQMSAQETTLFEFPCIGDDLNEKNRDEDPKFTLDSLRQIVDECSKPPAFRGVKTPITELLDQDTTKPSQKPLKDNPRDKGPKDKDNKGKLNSCATEKKGAPEGDKKGPSKLPAHERPSTFTQGLKRPDLNATVDGNKIVSEFQRQLYDDIAAGNCLRCHAITHSRASCKEPAGRWEAKFDSEKDKYWLGT
jgi:hypothetical protein